MGGNKQAQATFTSHWVVAQHCALAGVANALGQTAGHPFDLIKMRLQVQGHGVKLASQDKLYRGVLRGLLTVVQHEGIRGLYKGWVAAALFRELPYSGMRVGLYEPMKEVLGAKDPSNTPLWKKFVSGVCSGTIAAALVNPFDIMKVRFCAASPAEYAQLSSVVGEVRALYRADGFGGLWRGVTPSTLRGAAITAVQLSSYDHIKHEILNRALMDEGKALHFTSSILAATCAVLVTNPIDVIKTRVMNQRSSYVDAHCHRTYRGPLDCLQKVVRFEGVLALYKGTTGAWMRLGPHTVVSLMTFEQLRVFFGVRPM